MATEPASRALAVAARATRWAELPPVVRQQATDLFLDTVAVIAAGSAQAGYAPWVRGFAAEHGPCTALGLPQGVPAATAALLNGGATTVLQWQDGHRIARGHPASHLVPALLALAEQRESTAQALMSAFVAGYETGVRVGIALGGLQPALHDVGTWPTIGAAAACAHLLGGDASVIATAIEAAATVALLPYRDTARRGAAVHHLYAGIGATTAMAAAQSALAGFDALPGTIEAFFGSRAGAAFEAALLTDGIGPEGGWSRYELLSGYLKWHPVCAHFSGVADALGNLQRAFLREQGRPLARDQVVAVQVALCRAAVEFEAGLPQGDLAARFSVPAIVYAALDPDGLGGPALARTATQGDAARDWLARVEVAHDPTLDAGYPAGRPARVTLRCADGSTRTATVTDAYGDCTRPMSGADRRSKVLAALALRYGAGGAPVLQAFADFMDGAPIAAFSRALRAP
jgi:2-methylcitrate dehydratase PrpD